MRIHQLIFIGFIVVLSSCKTENTSERLNDDVSKNISLKSLIGRYEWVCCKGKHKGEIIFKSEEKGILKGLMTDLKKSNRPSSITAKLDNVNNLVIKRGNQSMTIDKQNLEQKNKKGKIKIKDKEYDFQLFQKRKKKNNQLPPKKNVDLKKWIGKYEWTCCKKQHGGKLEFKTSPKGILKGTMTDKKQPQKISNITAYVDTADNFIIKRGGQVIIIKRENLDSKNKNGKIKIKSKDYTFQMKELRK